jgi:hypothetical protein
MLGNIFIGDADTTNDIDPLEASAVIEAKGVDPVKLSTLAKLLKVKGAASGAPLDPSGEKWVIPISAALVAALAKLDKAACKKTATAWAKTEEWQSDGDAKYVTTLCTELVAIAAKAVKTKQPLYLWLCL